MVKFCNTDPFKYEKTEKVSSSNGGGDTVASIVLSSCSVFMSFEIRGSLPDSDSSDSLTESGQCVTFDRHTFQHYTNAVDFNSKCERGPCFITEIKDQQTRFRLSLVVSPALFSVADEAIIKHFYSNFTPFL